MRDRFLHSMLTVVIDAAKPERVRASGALFESRCNRFPHRPDRDRLP
jgi:hypothetical protein